MLYVHVQKLALGSWAEADVGAKEDKRKDFLWSERIRCEVPRELMGLLNRGQR